MVCHDDHCVIYDYAESVLVVCISYWMWTILYPRTQTT